MSCFIFRAGDVYAPPPARSPLKLVTTKDGDFIHPTVWQPLLAGLPTPPDPRAISSNGGVSIWQVSPTLQVDVSNWYFSWTIQGRDVLFTRSQYNATISANPEIFAMTGTLSDTIVNAVERARFVQLRVTDIEGELFYPTVSKKLNEQYQVNHYEASSLTSAWDKWRSKHKFLRRVEAVYEAAHFPPLILPHRFTTVHQGSANHNTSLSGRDAKCGPHNRECLAHSCAEAMTVWITIIDAALMKDPSVIPNVRRKEYYFNEAELLAVHRWFSASQSALSHLTRSHIRS